jgi:tryptophanyl-tRNA synthetase
MQRILSGVQPTGNLHLGNYLGAIRNWVALQQSYESLFCIVDLHAITVPQEPESLRKAVRETAAAFIACGVDPKKSAIFPQSAIAAHSELAWILGCFTPLGWLDRMTQFKSSDAKKTKIEKMYDHPTSVAAREAEKARKENPGNLGLYSYPVLMAADILVYKATHVPVGEDQKQHLELCRDIAGAFNRYYKQEFFPLPDPIILKHASRIMSLRDGTKKMSKSDESDYSRINLIDDADAIANKIKKAKSDMIEGDIRFDETRPEANNLLTIYAAIKNITKDEAEVEVASMNFSAFKKVLTDVAVAHLAPITQKMRELLATPDYIDKILAEGAARAGTIAGGTMKEVKDIVGFLKISDDR